MAELMHRTPALYELEGHQHRGLSIGIARHDKCAPFACHSPLKLHIEDSQKHPGQQVVTERCQCGKVVNAWSVLPEWPRLVPNNDEQDDCA